MLADYDSYMLTDAGLSTADMDAGGGVCSSGVQPDAPYLYDAWQGAADDAYTLTVLSDAPGQPPPPPYMDVWGAEPWQQHGPAHAGNPFDDDAVTGSDGSSSPDRRCVRSLLHVALQRGGSFAQQFTSCGVPPLPQPPPPSYPTAVKLEAPPSLASPPPAVFVSSTSSPRPATPADSSCYSPTPSPYPLPPLPLCDDAVVSTTSFPGGDGPGAFSPLPPPSYPMTFRTPYPTPYPTPSPDPCYPRLDAFPSPLAPLVPLPVHLLSGPAVPATPPPTPTSRAAKRRRSRKVAADAQGGGAAAPRKRERSERQLHPCTLCDKRFKDNYSVNVHMRTHTGEKPFPCIVCGKMFRQKAHLAKHRSTHQPAEWAAAAAAVAAHMPVSLDAEVGSEAGMGDVVGVAVDGNSNSLPMPVWAESKCKATNVWTPSIMSPPLSS